MRLSTFCGLRRDQEQLWSTSVYTNDYDPPPCALMIKITTVYTDDVIHRCVHWWLWSTIVYTDNYNLPLCTPMIMIHFCVHKWLWPTTVCTDDYDRPPCTVMMWSTAVYTDDYDLPSCTLTSTYNPPLSSRIMIHRCVKFGCADEQG